MRPLLPMSWVHCPGASKALEGVTPEGAVLDVSELRGHTRVDVATRADCDEERRDARERISNQRRFWSRPLR